MHHQPDSRTEEPVSATLELELMQAEQRAAGWQVSPGLKALEQLRQHCLRERLNIVQTPGEAVSPPARVPSRCAP